jgi:hypothetical protein
LGTRRSADRPRLRRTADDLHAARALLLKANDAGQQLVDNYRQLYTALTQLYTDFPRVYAELQRTVHLPTNEDAEWVTSMNNDMHRELSYLADDNFLRTLLDVDDLQVSVGDGEQTEN